MSKLTLVNMRVSVHLVAVAVLMLVFDVIVIVIGVRVRMDSPVLVFVFVLVTVRMLMLVRFVHHRLVSVNWVACAFVIRVLRRAFGAGANDREMREPSFVAELFPDTVTNGVKFLRCDGAHRAAPLAIEICPFVVAAEGIEPRAVAEMDVADKSVAFQQLEIAVDRTQVQPQTAHHILRRHRPVSREQRLEYQPSGGREPQPAAAELRDGVVQVADLQGGSIGSECHWIGT
jgi:hypothetical protein